ncbi:hypothetical protein B0T22DRAFT_486098 [Podospora appendiculata]|uniref:Uncharacterized protein n=1 Tax=Podospora appendiculata TaxID=314037 RepID=A0AAE0XEW6_9PEZI|nr:hypothetical protein B0T22DRAFT_486098 [Podospora appendiculata]
MTDLHITIDIILIALVQVAFFVIIAYWVYRIVPRLGGPPAAPVAVSGCQTMEPSGEIAIIVVIVFGFVFCFGYFFGKDSIVNFAQIMSAGKKSQAEPAPAPASSSSSAASPSPV